MHFHPLSHSTHGFRSVGWSYLHRRVVWLRTLHVILTKNLNSIIRSEILSFLSWAVSMNLLFGTMSCVRTAQFAKALRH